MIVVWSIPIACSTKINRRMNSIKSNSSKFYLKCCVSIKLHHAKDKVNHLFISCFSRLFSNDSDLNPNNNATKFSILSIEKSLAIDHFYTMISIYNIHTSFCF